MRATGLRASEPPARRDGFRAGLTAVSALIAVMWGVEVLDLVAGDLDAAGIEPREGDGLAGVVAAPFLHAGFGHLIANTVPLVLLGFLLALDGARRVLAVTALVALVSGLGVWLLGPAGSLHVGASGVVFGWVTYLASRGLYSRNLLHIAAGIAVAAVYGTTILLGVLPATGVSWQGHLFGALGGVVTARVLHRRRARPERGPTA